MAFRYQQRSADAWERRANQTSGEFESFLKEECTMYRPKKGDNSIRILPPSFPDAEHYGIDIFVHYSVGPLKASVLCLQHMKGERCPICEARARYLKIGDEEAAGELKPAKRVLVWVLDRNDEDRGALVWSMPYTLDREFSKLAKDRQSGEILMLDHPDKGYDLYFDRTGEGKLVQYGGKSLAHRPSAVSDEVLEYIEQRPLPDMLIWRTYQELKELYEGGAEPTETNVRPLRTAEEPATRRRVVRDEAPQEPVRRREEEPVSRRRETVSRRVEAPEDRREAINREVPFDGGRTINGEVSQEPEPPKNTAQRLREQYGR